MYLKGEIINADLSMLSVGGQHITSWWKSWIYTCSHDQSVGTKVSNGNLNRQTSRGQLTKQTSKGQPKEQASRKQTNSGSAQKDVRRR